MTDDAFKALKKEDVEHLQMLLDKAEGLYMDCRTELAASNDQYQTFRETLDSQAQLAMSNLERQAAADIADKDAAIAALLAEKDAAIASLQEENASLTTNAAELADRIAAFEKEGLLPSVVAARKAMTITSETQRLADAQATAANAMAELAQLNKDSDSPAEPAPAEPAPATPAMNDVTLEPSPQ